MTKKELLELLKDVPDDGLIVVNGHSDGDGYDDCYEAQEIKIVRNTRIPSWQGEYIYEQPNSMPEEIITAYVIR
jgi:hypothetical protein